MVVSLLEFKYEEIFKKNMNLFLFLVLTASQLLHYVFQLEDHPQLQGT